MKRQRSDSATAAVAAMQAAFLPIDPPKHVTLRIGDRPFWDGIVYARARVTWTDIDLAHAANLARCQADIERLQGEIDVEGDVLASERGAPVVNPKHLLLERYSRRAISLARVLHVHAEATVGKSSKQAEVLSAEKAAKKAAKAADDADDGLIPRLRAIK